MSMPIGGVHAYIFERPRLESIENASSFRRLGLYVYTKDADGRVRSRRDVGVFFIPMTGAMQNQPRPAGAAG